MISFFKKIFGNSTTELTGLLNSGAVVIDVRTKDEFSSGNVKGSINVPLDQIISSVEKLKKHEQIIVCCRSGNRSGQAKSILNSRGFQNVTNGGSWQNVNNHLKNNLK